ncbi:probable rRNA methyltransferase 3, mitochondrial [Coccomyxa sp. Obi]|nr:probable rRNA methyltransferase 3, mitochondrial [Coccomyxa sp. Obi]
MRLGIQGVLGPLAFRNLPCTPRVPVSTPKRRVVTSGLPRVFCASQPLTDTITSTTNSYVKHCCKLRSSRAYREESASVLVVGSTPIQEIAGHTTIKTLFLAPDVDQLPGIAATCTLRVSEPVLKKLSCLETVAGLKAVAEVDTPPTADFVENYQPGQIQRLLALERVQDPGNLGSLLRTAAGLGWDGVFLLPGCCDPFNDKALRASRGAAFKLPIGVGDWQVWPVAGHGSHSRLPQSHLLWSRAS